MGQIACAVAAEQARAGGDQQRRALRAQQVEADAQAVAGLAELDLAVLAQRGAAAEHRDGVPALGLRRWHRVFERTHQPGGDPVVAAQAEQQPAAGGDPARPPAAQAQLIEGEAEQHQPGQAERRSQPGGQLCACRSTSSSTMASTPPTPAPQASAFHPGTVC